LAYSATWIAVTTSALRSKVTILASPRAWTAAPAIPASRVTTWVIAGPAAAAAVPGDLLAGALAGELFVRAEEHRRAVPPVRVHAGVGGRGRRRTHRFGEGQSDGQPVDLAVDRVLTSVAWPGASCVIIAMVKDSPSPPPPP
jgi:hypothetical protein